MVNSTTSPLSTCKCKASNLSVAKKKYKSVHYFLVTTAHSTLQNEKHCFGISELKKRSALLSGHNRTLQNENIDYFWSFCNDDKKHLLLSALLSDKQLKALTMLVWMTQFLHYEQCEERMTVTDIALGGMQLVQQDEMVFSEVVMD